MDGWNTIFLPGFGLFSGAFAVSFREGILSSSSIQGEPRKKPSYFPLYWMVNRDPYNGLL